MPCVSVVCPGAQWLLRVPLPAPRGGRRNVPSPRALRDYLELLAAEPSAAARLRIMVLGFGGVGKTTFCAAATRHRDDLGTFRRTLAGVESWDAARVAKWALGLGTPFDAAAAAVFRRGRVSGADLPRLVASEAELEALAGGALAPGPQKGASLSPSNSECF